MTYRRALAGVLVLTSLLAPLLAACGGADDGGAAKDSVAKTPQQQELLAAYERLTTAFNAGDGDTYCAGLTPATARAEGELFDKSCEDLVGGVPGARPSDGRVESARRSRVIAVAIEGDRGTVTYRQPGAADRPMTVDFVERDGRWLGDWTVTFGRSVPN